MQLKPILFPIIEEQKKSIQSYVHWLHKEREIWYSLISWVSPWLNEKALLDEAVKLNTPFVNWNANTESNCYSRQLFLIVMFTMGVVVQQKIVAFFLLQIKCDLYIEKYLIEKKLLSVSCTYKYISR